MNLLFAFLLFAAAAQPDLIVDQAYTANSIGITTETFLAAGCAVQEGDITAGTHRLLTFGTEVANIGTGDLNVSRHDGTWIYGTCHQHWHFEDFTNYTLLDSSGATVGQGHKQAFCIEDVVRYLPTASTNAKYTCQHMGIQNGWADTYSAGLSGQWIVIDNVPAGNYTLQIQVNYNNVLAESNYANNVTTWPVTVP